MGGGEFRSASIRDNLGAFSATQELSKYCILRRRIDIGESELKWYSDLATLETLPCLKIAIDEITSRRRSTNSIVFLSDYAIDVSNIHFISLISSIEDFYIKKKDIKSEEMYNKVLSRYSCILTSSIKLSSSILIPLSGSDGLVAVVMLVGTNSPVLDEIQISSTRPEDLKAMMDLSKKGLNFMFI